MTKQVLRLHVDELFVNRGGEYVPGEAWFDVTVDVWEEPLLGPNGCASGTSETQWEYVGAEFNSAKFIRDVEPFDDVELNQNDIDCLVSIIGFAGEEGEIELVEGKLSIGSMYDECVEWFGDPAKETKKAVTAAVAKVFSDSTVTA